MKTRKGGKTMSSAAADSANNVAIGVDALKNGSDVGNQSVAVGYRALEAQNNPGSTNTENIGVGYLAGGVITTGYGNTCVGSLAGEYGGNSLTTGTFNTLLGVGAIPSANSGSAQIVLTAPGSRSSTTGKGNNTGFIAPNGGAVYQGNNSSSWSTTSDKRLKKNIVDSTIGLAEINKLQIKNFEYKTLDDLSEIEADGLTENDIINKEGVQVGVIAQEIKAVLPKCVKEETTGVLSVDADNITWHLVKAVQELSAKNDALEARIKKLEDG